MNVRSLIACVRSGFGRHKTASRRRHLPRHLRQNLETLERRELLSATTVSDIHPMFVEAHHRAAAVSNDYRRGRSLADNSDQAARSIHATATPTVVYYNATEVAGSVELWQGIRGANQAGTYLICGTTVNGILGNTPAGGILYVGPISGVHGRSYTVSFPGAFITSVYGPDELGAKNVRLVGSYRTANDPGAVHGFYYQGSISVKALDNPGNYHTMDYPGAKYNYVHSTSGELIVGNESAALVDGEPVQAYLYNLSTGQYSPITYQGAESTTAYGIWHNGGSSYTITGGYVTTTGAGAGFLVDYDSSTGSFTHWRSISYPNAAAGSDAVTHIEGISSVKPGVYTLSADSYLSDSFSTGQGLFVTIRRNANGAFGSPRFVKINATNATSITSANSVYGNQVVGIVVGANPPPYQATVQK
jgi:hypothetical protein